MTTVHIYKINEINFIALSNLLRLGNNSVISEKSKNLHLARILMIDMHSQVGTYPML